MGGGGEGENLLAVLVTLKKEDVKMWCRAEPSLSLSLSLSFSPSLSLPLSFSTIGFVPFIWPLHLRRAHRSAMRPEYAPRTQDTLCLATGCSKAVVKYDLKSML
jgi:hypothetical protein